MNLFDVTVIEFMDIIYRYELQILFDVDFQKGVCLMELVTVIVSFREIFI
jgi:hypothetical protein